MGWRNVLGGHLGRMTHVQAAASLRRIQFRVGATDQPEVCRLTGLTPSQVTPGVVQHVCEQLVEHVKANLPTARQFDPTEQGDG